ncbi:triphosphoribosyl-dephospho-CoA synthase CitG [Aminivibrio sp.]|jgi:holo-ACP synthase/triphosphoribosyl-dephospho-CoA synthase|uniref:triphosphoribosyl-dephospho-CoA synthase CitG n=1 Tax=Aminivibrio sp. TaxID=1872489 RepID=UPI001A4BB1C1|nr:triphosphoribosyl-dephospho-CoA synthase CitG [Aminivibrio sp.]MBL3540129.1 triphosphoribosyl-dephospho-CoA synthase CitG [Aminivibrio sp.]
MNSSVLDAREGRWNRRRALAATLPAGWSVLSFTLRMPAALRLGGEFDRDAEGLFRDLVFHLGSRGFSVESTAFAVRADGPEGLCSVRGGAAAVKRAAVVFEEEHPRGCLADGDVMDSLSGEVGRESLALPPRRCLVCGRRAAECVAGRTHNTEEIRASVERILSFPGGVPGEEPVSFTAETARKAVLFETAASPKPGLVDPLSRGAHGDMDYFTFLASAAALASEWERFARLGARFRGDDPAGLLSSLREEGLRAERKMFSATGGINTHKGLIFSLGVLCASAGMLASEGIPLSPEACASRGAAIVRGITERDFAFLKGTPGGRPLTAGERLFLSDGVTGIRGEAERGFPSVTGTALPALRSSLSKGLSLNDAMVDGLLALMTVVEDTNILSRGGREGERTVRKEAEKAVKLGGMSSKEGKEAVQKMNGLFTRRNLSPGGSADLLAVTVFLHLLIPASG